MSLDHRLNQRLADLRVRDALRTPPPVSARAGVRYQLGGRPVVGFCSNDYLGLAGRPMLSSSTLPGAAASRLICGDLEAHREAERALAELVGAKDAVVFPSGFQLNVGTLPCLLEPTDLAYSDRLNHASLIDGLRLARASVQILPHGDAPPTAGPGRWWITESIYSMDGDRIDIDAVRNHRRRGGFTYVDEAHALGLFRAGRGLFADGELPDVLVGTLSKAFGCAGAFAAGTESLCSWLRNRARSYVFSTGVSPRILSDITRAIERVAGPEGDRRRARLWSNIATFAEALALPTAPRSPIVPLLVGPNRAALELSARLLERGWHVQAIRPPTVPESTARLRVTLSADHDADQITGLAADLRELFDAEGRPIRTGLAA